MIKASCFIRNLCLNQVCKGIPSMLPYRSFIIQAFTFMAMIHLELVFMYGWRRGMWFNFFPNWIFSCSNIFCLKDSFSFELTWQLGHKAILVHF